MIKIKKPEEIKEFILKLLLSNEENIEELKEKTGCFLQKFREQNKGRSLDSAYKILEVFNYRIVLRERNTSTEEKILDTDVVNPTAREFSSLAEKVIREEEWDRYKIKRSKVDRSRLKWWAERTKIILVKTLVETCKKLNYDIIIMKCKNNE